jgi:rhodanese-related sulfurtransferase
MPTDTDVKTISKEELAGLIQQKRDVQIVNVLAPEYYGLGMIKGSIRIPRADIEQRAGELDKSREVIVYCANSHCPKSREAAQALSKAGFNVRAYEGGIEEWNAANLPKDPVTEPSKTQPNAASVDQPSGLTGMGVNH